MCDAEFCKYNASKTSPPYMITEPDIVTRDLVSPAGEILKFVILAVDGCEWSYIILTPLQDS